MKNKKRVRIIIIFFYKIVSDTTYTSVNDTLGIGTLRGVWLVNSNFSFRILNNIIHFFTCFFYLYVYKKHSNNIIIIIETPLANGY